ncbi:MAG: nitroreductase family deazaflavin-dependent oxidoreductase [Chloroflexota bacterium]
MGKGRSSAAAGAPMHEGRFQHAILRPIWLRAGVVSMLEVPGRVTGATVRVPLVPWEVDGTRYLLSNYGISQWVRNLRASGRAELRRRGRAEGFTAVEVDGQEREQVVAKFRARTPKPFQHDYNQRSDPDDHPAFRIVPLASDFVGPLTPPAQR